MTLIDHMPLQEAIAPDADDDNILAAAIAGNCDYVITGDKGLLGVKSFRAIPIVSISEFRQIDLERK